VAGAISFETIEWVHDTICSPHNSAPKGRQKPAQGNALGEMIRFEH